MRADENAKYLKEEVLNGFSNLDSPQKFVSPKAPDTELRQ